VFGEPAMKGPVRDAAFLGQRLDVDAVLVDPMEHQTLWNTSTQSGGRMSTARAQNRSAIWSPAARSSALKGSSSGIGGSSPS
jgi:hypothetical protein